MSLYPADLAVESFYREATDQALRRMHAGQDVQQQRRFSSPLDLPKRPPQQPPSSQPVAAQVPAAASPSSERAEGKGPGRKANSKGGGRAAASKALRTQETVERTEPLDTVGGGLV